jgi:GDP-4-dehydro-6-deoxy-D-mannose reductase|tara:strand:- start:75834 stop:76787 length:954 start_codon:yes stop_codon:yes gene_type:complete
MNGKHILITGISGFLGRHLRQLLKKRFPLCTITGVGRNSCETHSEDTFYKIDLLNEVEVYDLICGIKPDYVFHLAGLVFSYDWESLYNNNVTATVNLLEAIKKSNIKTQVTITGSAAEYGAVSLENLPIEESYLSIPKSPYGLTKLWQTDIGRYYNTATTPVSIARIFNVIAYDTAPKLSTGDLFTQLQRIAQHMQEPYVFAGNFQIKRDFLDVSDACAALISIAKSGKPGNIYNVCSGHSISLKNILNLALSVSGLTVEMVIDESRVQNAYVMDIYGCNEKIKRDTHWRPVVTMQDSIKKALRLPCSETYSDEVLL